ncbi:MAG: patatin-like phospholipase family protein [Hyphomicrobiales bacterium]|nr:patatin-like phospholipase family protein [Hyphomicrobiales bacterium]
MGKPKIGIALGGGAARGWAHIGVLRALERAGLAPDIVAGTSIGAVAGGCYVAGRLDELEKFTLSLTKKRVFGFLDFNFAGSGLITGKRLCDELDEYLRPVLIEDMERKFVAIATEMGTGHEIWLSKGRLVNAMHASYALPGIFRPVNISGRWLMDGALVNPIPVSVCRALGARVVIAVNLNSEYFGKGAVVPDQEAHAEPELPDENMALPAGNGRAAKRLLHRQFFGRSDGAPGISSVMMDAFNIIQDRIARSRLAGDPPDLMISPKLSQMGLFDFHRGSEAIAAGTAATEKELDDIQQSIDTLAA